MLNSKIENAHWAKKTTTTRCGIRESATTLCGITETATTRNFVLCGCFETTTTRVRL